MATVALVLALTSGFAVLRYPEPTYCLIATSLAIDATLAPLTATIAARHARAWRLWLLLGFCFGLWALLVVLIISRQDRDSRS